ncbi:hypothetical protein CLU79DRAFT_882168, partial [Phycomyces nitens]
DFAERLNETIYKALDDSVGRTSPRPKAWKSFWTDELQHLADLCQERYRWRRRVDNDIERMRAHAEYVATCQDLRKAVRAARRQSWYDFCEKIQKDPTKMLSAIKRMRMKQRFPISLASTKGPLVAANNMIDHLETAFGGSTDLRPGPVVTPLEEDVP